MGSINNKSELIIQPNIPLYDEYGKYYELCGKFITILI